MYSHLRFHSASVDFGYYDEALVLKAITFQKTIHFLSVESFLPLTCGNSDYH